MTTFPIEQLAQLPFIKRPPSDGRTVFLLPWFNEQTGSWELWIPVRQDVIGRIAGGEPALGGVLLLRNHPWGVPLSAVVQGMQIPVILGPGASYYANFGLGLRLTMDTGWNLGLFTYFGSELHYSWQSDRTTTALGINLVAAVLLYLLATRVEEATARTPGPLDGAA